jgi:hypothetical protein
MIDHLPILSIHAHKTCLPLLANFPKKRVDVNPYHTPKFFSTERFGELSLSPFRELVNQCNSIIFVFLDSFTVNNLPNLDIESLENDVYLFIGDTQHGSLPGFEKLIAHSQSKNIRRIFFVNNPQHAHWFSSDRFDKPEMFYLPLGFANYESSESETEFPIRENIIHVGSRGSTHAYRGAVISGLLQFSTEVLVLETPDYRLANHLYGQAAAAINVSLNGDISFRISEILVSGGRCITDELPFPQKRQLDLYGLRGIRFFASRKDLAWLVSSKEYLQSDFWNDSREGVTLVHEIPNLSDLDFINKLSTRIVDPRFRTLLDGEPHPRQLLTSYLRVRDYCLGREFNAITIIVDNEFQYRLLLALLDIPRLTLTVFADSDYFPKLQNHKIEWNLSYLLHPIVLGREVPRSVARHR